LWSDIVNLHNTHREEHFVGYILRIDENLAAGSTFTLTLLLVALRDYTKENVNCGGEPE
jgi:hypothetical protein